MPKPKVERDSTQHLRDSAFAQAYVELQFNATEAALKVGDAKDRSSASVTGYRMLKRARVQTMIRQLRVELSQKTGLTAEWLERRMMENMEAAPIGSAARTQALAHLGKRLPGFFEPERMDVTMMTPEQREARKRDIIERAAQRAGAVKK